MPSNAASPLVSVVTPVFNGERYLPECLIDLNLLKAYFLDHRNRGNLDVVRTVIEQNAAASGWLIFATHDVAAGASRFGCEPEYFEEVVRLALRSGASILPMTRVCQEMRIAR